MNRILYNYYVKVLYTLYKTSYYILYNFLRDRIHKKITDYYLYKTNFVLIITIEELLSDDSYNNLYKSYDIATFSSLVKNCAISNNSELLHYELNDDFFNLKLIIKDEDISWKCPKIYFSNGEYISKVSVSCYGELKRIFDNKIPSHIKEVVIVNDFDREKYEIKANYGIKKY